MNIKTVVKVMNFHSLLRVDKARKSAEKYSAMEKALAEMMSLILNNRNLKLDNYIKLPSENLPPLRIYLGSDYGFCGNINSSVSSVMGRDERSRKIIVGKKLKNRGDAIVYSDESSFDSHFDEIRGLLTKAVKEKCWSSVELCYNHYYNMGTIRQIIRRIYPLAPVEGTQKNTDDDFIIEGDHVALLEDMIIEYLSCELMIASKSAYASENVLRQNVTSESLKKIDEIEEQELREERKYRNMLSFKKTVDSSIKQKALRKG